VRIFIVDFLFSPKENEPKERAPCHSVLLTFLCFSKGPALEETRFAQTVHELNPDLSAMLDLVTTGLKNDMRGSLVIILPPREGFLGPPALQAEAHYVDVPTAMTGYLKSDSFLTGMRSINLRQTRQASDPGFVGSVDTRPILD
jgi:hypothetical protein